MTDSQQRYGVVTEEAGRGAVYEGHGPQAVYDEDTHTTYVVYRGPDADPYATAYDHDTGAFAEPTRIGENPLSNQDNHGPPSVVIDDDGHMLAFYGSHGQYHQVARTTSPKDVSDWENLGEMNDVPGGTYPSPVRYDGDVYVLYRAGPPWDKPTYPSAQYATLVRTSDGGRSFEDLGPILDVSGHPDEISICYVKDISIRDDRFHVTWFVCHDHAAPVTAASQHRSGIYHGVYDPNDGSMYDLAGNEYEAPLTWEEMQGTPVQAFDAMDVNHPKHAQLEAGPAILFGNHDPASPNFEDGTSRMEWLVAFWRDGRWRIERITDAFATHLFDGGYARVNEDGQLECHIITGGDDPDLVDGSRGGDFEVATYTGDGFERDVVASAEAVGQPLSRVTTVEHGRDEFASLFQPASDDAATFDIPLFAYGTAWDEQ